MLDLKASVKHLIFIWYIDFFLHDIFKIVCKLVVA